MRAERSSKKCGGAGQSGRTLNESVRVEWWLEASVSGLLSARFVVFGRADVISEIQI